MRLLASTVRCRRRQTEEGGRLKMEKTIISHSEDETTGSS
jgi:hypothetical protein